MPKHARLALILLGALAPLACSPADNDGPTGAAGTSASGAAGTGQNTGTAGTGTNTGTAGTTGAAGSGAAGTGTNTGAAGTGTAGTGTGTAGTGAGTAGTGAGTAGTGAGTAGSTGAAGTGVAPGDTAPWRALNVTGAKMQRTHNIFGNSVGLDTRAAKMAGKLIVDLGVDSGGYQGWLGKRGFHVFGVKFYHCAHIDSWGAPYGREYHANCRLTTFDGVQRGGAENDGNGVTAADSIAGKIKSGLAMLHQMYPEDDWGYFLNQDGTVRWSDVGFTGYSHGAQTAAALAHHVRLYRAVSRSGPRDNNCGSGAAFACPPSAAAPPYNATCPQSSIAAWQDMPFVTPKERAYSFAGTQDGQYGDDQFSTFHMQYQGEVVDIGKPGPYNSTRFCANTGHGGFETYIDAINEAFGVLPENKNPTF